MKTPEDLSPESTWLTLEEQGGSGEKYGRERDLRDHQDTSPEFETRTCGALASSIFECFVNISTRREDGGRHSEENAGSDRERCSKPQHVWR